jgi:hypothetical protein
MGEWNEGFKHLERLGNLYELDLQQTGVNDAGLKRISEGCPGLEDLALSFCHHVSPAGLQHLGKLPFLMELDMSEWQDYQECGPWQDSFLDGLVARLNRANAIEEGEDEEEGEEGSLDGVFNLECLDLTSTAWTEAGGHMKPGPNVLALRDAGVYVKMGYDE